MSVRGSQPSSGGVGMLAGLCCAALVGQIFTSGVEEDHLGWTLFQASVLWSLLILFGWVAGSMGGQSPASKAAHEARVKAACAEPGDIGLTLEWYQAATRFLGRLKTAMGVVGALAGVAVYVLVMPSTISVAIRAFLQSNWERVLESHSREWIFFVGIYGAHLSSFWIMSAIFAVLDFTRPAFMKPFKIQETEWVSAKKYLLGAAVAMVNCVFTLIESVLVCKYFYIISPNGYSKELPHIGTAILQIAAALPITEFTFYFGHKLMHTEFGMKHIHWIHHSWTAPVALAAVFAHPVEHVLVNFSTVLAGPLFTGAHVSVYIVWVFASTVSTCLGHSGWHLPFLGSSEAHDYHHIQGLDNLGTLGILDVALHTNQTYIKSPQAQVDKNYGGPDYPVDKAIANAAHKTAEAEEFSVVTKRAAPVAAAEWVVV